MTTIKRILLVGASVFAFQQAHAQLTSSNFVCDLEEEDLILQIEEIKGEEVLIAREPGTTGPDDIYFGAYVLAKTLTQTDELIIEASVLALGDEALIIKAQFPTILNDGKSLGKLYYIERTRLNEGKRVEKIVGESELVCRRNRDI